jgi:hypothetical protein
MTAAPLGAPPLPTVEPTPQHLEGVTQVTATIELMGVGAATGSNEPLHGDPEANAIVAWVVDGPPEEWPAEPDEHAARVAAARPTSMRALRFPRRDVPLMVVLRLADFDDVRRCGLVVPGLATAVPQR